MLDIRNGQVVHNSRTGDNGKVVGKTTRWNGRHNVNKLVVDVQGIEKVWAYSSCKVVEELAPRSLVQMKSILVEVLRNAEKFKQMLRTKYSNNTFLINHIENGGIKTLIEHLGSAEKFRYLAHSGVAHCLMYIELTSQNQHNMPHMDLPFMNYADCNKLTSELFSVYFNLKAQ